MPVARRAPRPLAGCARRSPIEKPGDAGSTPATSTTCHKGPAGVPLRGGHRWRVRGPSAAGLASRRPPEVRVGVAVGRDLDTLDQLAKQLLAASEATTRPRWTSSVGRWRDPTSTVNTATGPAHPGLGGPTALSGGKPRRVRSGAWAVPRVGPVGWSGSGTGPGLLHGTMGSPFRPRNSHYRPGRAGDMWPVEEHPGSEKPVAVDTAAVMRLLLAVADPSTDRRSSSLLPSMACSPSRT